MKFLILTQDVHNHVHRKNLDEFLREIRRDGFDIKKSTFYFLVLSNRNETFRCGRNMTFELKKSSPILQFVQLPSLALRIYIINRNYAADVIYTPLPYLGSTFLLAKAFSNSKTMCFMRGKVHEMILSKRKTFARRLAAGMIMFLDRIAFKICDIILHNGKNMQEYVERSRTAAQIIYFPRKIMDSEHLSSFSSADILKLKHELGITGKKIILSVSRTNPEKNIKMMLDALNNLPEDYVLVHVGSGPEEKELIQYSDKKGVKDRFIIIGFVPHKAIWEYYRMADVFVLCSTTEGTPNVVKEAMLAGTPCIVSDIPGNRNLITDKKTGLLFSLQDPRQLAYYIHLLCENKKKREGITKNALLWITEEQKNVRTINQLLVKIQ